MKKVILIVLTLMIISFTSCQQSHIIVPNPANPSDPNSTMELWGEAANIWIQQMADNVTNEASRIEDLFRYNGIMYAGLFIILLGGVLFALLTKSSWMWYIPITAGGGLLTLIFIVQAVLYIKWIFLTALIVLVGIFVFKTWQYKKREIVALLKLEEKK